jgi:hypothetical protein
MTYLWSDAWLLQAVALAARERPATLAEVIGYADAVNHALPTSDELHGGFGRLTMGGFVEEVEARFQLTVLVSAESRSRILAGGWEEGRQVASEVLDAETWTAETNVGDPRNAVVYPGLTVERIRKAEREYFRSCENVTNK